MDGWMYDTYVNYMYVDQYAKRTDSVAQAKAETEIAPKPATCQVVNKWQRNE